MCAQVLPCRARHESNPKIPLPLIANLALPLIVILRRPRTVMLPLRRIAKLPLPI